MAAVYASARELVDDIVTFVLKLLERQIVAHWEYGLIPAPADRGLGLAPADVVLVQVGGVRALTTAAVAELGKLDGEVTARLTSIYDKLEATRAAGAALPLDELRARFQLTATEERSLWVVLACEVSPRVRQLVRYLENDMQRAVPDVGLLDTLVYSAPGAREHFISELGPSAPLFKHHLLEVLAGPRGREAFVTRGVRVAPRVLDLAAGELRLDPDLTKYANIVALLGGELFVPADVLSTAARLVEDGPVNGRASPLICMVGRLGSGRKAVLGAAARGVGKSLLRIRCGDLPTDAIALTEILGALFREATILDALPVLDELEELIPPDGEGGGEDRARNRRIDSALSDWEGAIAATATTDDIARLRVTRGMVRLDVPPIGEGDRATLWRQELEGSGKLDPVMLAARYPVTGGTILTAASSARSLAAARGSSLSEADVHAGLRGAMEDRIAALGTRVTWSQKWEDLVLPEDIVDALREFVARVKHRRQVYDEWGFAEKLAKGLGLSALFSGPPGTGKSMVAGVIGSQLGLDIYQIEVSRIISKYIGETEKNLAKIFDAAEAGASILLFDEADSLFASRGEVKSSTDRYANLEVNYLLQRMERFSGITILTTNLAASIDPAFKRRIAFTIEFPMPEAEERAMLWQRHLPKRAQFAPDIDYDWLADRFEMSGGHIRNAVLRAAFLAADEGGRIGHKHMKRAAELEYQAMGKVI
ncbi:MAG TPA: ATP-binding protein [Kofleriaceae bacterium]|jgi:hypothetical protein